MPIVVLRNNKQFSIQGKASILEAAKLNNIVLEYSCRTGRCGVCKAKVIAGSTSVIKTEECLSCQESADGIILTCCRTADSDIQLDIDDLGQLANIDIKTLPCRINEIEHLTSDVIRIILRLPPNCGFDYLSGQYIDVIGKQGLRRSYSIANANKGSGQIELFIRKVENGLMSNYWFNEAKINDLLRFEGPLGTFFLRDNNPYHIIFLATGTGIAPVKAILEDISKYPEIVSKHKFHLYWGQRSKEDLYWRPDFKEIDLSYQSILSRQNTNWEGRNGYIQNALLEDKIPINDSVVLACGSNDMILSAKSLLVAHGLDESNFYSDAFVCSN